MADELSPEPQKKFVPPVGSWEDDVMSITTIEEVRDPIPGKGGRTKENKKLVAHVQWNNGRRTLHDLGMIRRKCPQKMLDYYEAHLVFKTAEEVMEMNGEGEGDGDGDGEGED
ncbi:hypothetical protein LTR28_006961 [Elasticomyces elasticus]|nr:hypothetical protein LTR28_006961 [Elasticomyces elasticus]